MKTYISKIDGKWYAYAGTQETIRYTPSAQTILLVVGGTLGGAIRAFSTLLPLPNPGVEHTRRPDGMENTKEKYNQAIKGNGGRNNEQLFSQLFLRRL